MQHVLGYHAQWLVSVFTTWNETLTHIRHEQDRLRHDVDRLREITRADHTIATRDQMLEPTDNPSDSRSYNSEHVTTIDDDAMSDG